MTFKLYQYGCRLLINKNGLIRKSNLLQRTTFIFWGGFYLIIPHLFISGDLYFLMELSDQTNATEPAALNGEPNPFRCPPWDARGTNLFGCCLCHELHMMFVHLKENSANPVIMGCPWLSYTCQKRSMNNSTLGYTPRMQQITIMSIATHPTEMLDMK